MVNNRIVSRFADDLPKGPNRLIQDTPLYQCGDVLEILERKDRGSIVAWTENCIKDVQNLNLDDNDLVDLIKIAVSDGSFLGAEWCEQKTNGPWAASDAYLCRRVEWMPYMRREVSNEYYIKFAISMSGNILLLVSCHPPRNR